MVGREQLCGFLSHKDKDKELMSSIKKASERCPLWTYILAETKEVTVKLQTTQGEISISTRHLGPVGGRIVAETFIGLLLLDETSYFNQDPVLKPKKANADGRFGLKEFIQTALSA